MHFSFSAIYENADENEILFSSENENHLCHISQNYGSVANKTFSAQRKGHFWNENEK